jgi:hypothetical protein
MNEQAVPLLFGGDVSSLSVGRFVESPDISFSFKGMVNFVCHAFFFFVDFMRASSTAKSYNEFCET